MSKPKVPSVPVVKPKKMPRVPVIKPIKPIMLPVVSKISVPKNPNKKKMN